MKTLLTILFLLGSMSIFANTDVMTNNSEVSEGEQAVARADASICSGRRGEAEVTSTKTEESDDSGVQNEG